MNGLQKYQKKNFFTVAFWDNPHYPFWDLRSRDLKKILGYDINYLSIWPFMCHPWFPTRKASKLTFICFQHQVLNTLQGLDNWSWKQINVSFEAFLVGNQWSWALRLKFWPFFTSRSSQWPPYWARSFRSVSDSRDLETNYNGPGRSLWFFWRPKIALL